MKCDSKTKESSGPKEKVLKSPSGETNIAKSLKLISPAIKVCCSSLNIAMNIILLEVSSIALVSSFCWLVGI